MKKLTLTFLLLMISPSLALAWNNPPPKPTTPSSTKIRIDVDAKANAKANAEQKQSQEQSQGQQQSQSANNEGVSQSVNTEAVRQAPSVGQGSFAIVGCGAAGNAGGSNSHGSAFLGFGFTPAECYKYMTAASYQAIGEYDTACLILNTTKAAKRAAKDGVVLPNCKRPAPVVETEYVTRAELQEREARLLKTITSK